MQKTPAQKEADKGIGYNQQNHSHNNFMGNGEFNPDKLEWNRFEAWKDLTDHGDKWKVGNKTANQQLDALSTNNKIQALMEQTGITDKKELIKV